MTGLIIIKHTGLCVSLQYELQSINHRAGVMISLLESALILAGIDFRRQSESDVYRRQILTDV